MRVLSLAEHPPSSPGHSRTARSTEAGVQADAAMAKDHLLQSIGHRVGTVSDLGELVAQIVQMTQRALEASASSVLLLDEERQELVFDLAEGGAAGELKGVRMSVQSGIAGWVARNGRPSIVNDVSRDGRHYPGIDDTTGFTTEAIMCAPLKAHGKMIGVLEVLNKLDGTDFNDRDLELLVSVAGTAALSIENSRLHQSVTEGYKATIAALAATIDAKDPYTRGHTQTVMRYALEAGRALSLPKSELEILEYGSLLHDIGKIGIPDAVLGKPGPLDAQERELVNTHPSIGAEIVGEVPFLAGPLPLVLHHHERYDGTGYPAGLVGDGIPRGARLLAVADAYDAMTTDRAYRLAMSRDTALQELVRGRGSQFCPWAVEGFLSSRSRDDLGSTASETRKLGMTT